MMRSLWSAASGMVAQQANIDVIANNLANVNTTGFKKIRTDFQDLIYQTIRQAGATADNARRYLHNFADQTDIRGKQQQLKELLVRQEHLNRQMAALCRDILDETSQTPDALPNYYCRIPDDWPHSGTTVGALRFWQATGATIVAIRRGLSYIVSPGPYAELYAGDAVIFVGGVKAREAVSHFFANP